MTATLPDRWGVRRRWAVCATLTVTAAVTGGALVASPAGASANKSAATATSSLRGHLASVQQTRGTRRVQVAGFAYDNNERHARVRVGIFVDGRYRRTVTAGDASSAYDRRRHIHGRHGFTVSVPGPKRASEVSLVVHRAQPATGRARRDTMKVRHMAPQGQRIVAVAKRYVGSRYSYGADGPSAFDCSGYAKFVYRKADVAALPHNSESQRHARHMHRITRSHARPGDLVFYLSGGDAYHVAIYAGHGRQYSATNPSQGVEHDKISSHNVVFGTDWH